MSNSKRLNSIGMLSDTLLLHYLVSQDYESQARDYGLNEILNRDVPLHSLEIHLLTAIDENPGISSQELARKFFRSKGAISQRIKVLTKYGLITRETSSENHRVSLLYTTETGKIACKNHIAYDHERHIVYSELLKDFSEEEIEICQKIVLVMTESLHEQRKETD